MKLKRLFLISGLILIAAIVRLLPHPPNFAPITAIALFGGAYISDKRLAFALPLFALFLGDLILGFHSTMIFVYLSFALIVGLGFLLREKRGVGRIALASLSGSVLFFVITNFGMLATGTLYPMTLGGLGSCYVAAIPFFQNAVAGDLVYTGVIFGYFALVQNYLPAFRMQN